MSKHHTWNLKCKVFVGNLHHTTTEEDITSHFEKFGVLKNVCLAGNPSRFAFVEFENPYNAENAVAAMNRRKISGATIVVEMASNKSCEKPEPEGSTVGRPKTESDRPGTSLHRDANASDKRESHRDMNVWCKVYVGDIGSGTTRQHLEAFFKNCGHLKDVWVAKDHAYVEFKYEQDAEDAVRDMDQKILRGANVRVLMASSRSRKIPKPEGSRNGGRGDGTHESRLKKDANGKDERDSDNFNVKVDYTIHVSNLKPGTTRQDLETSFGRYGTVDAAWVTNDHGYVEFKHRHHAKDAVRDTDLQIRAAKVTVRMASSRSRESPQPGGIRDAGRKDDRPGSSGTKRKKSYLSSPSRRRSRSSSPKTRSPRRSSRSSAVPSSSSRRERSRSRSRSPLRRTVPSSVTWITDHRKMDKNCKVFIGNMGSGASRDDLEASFREYGNLKKGGVTNVWISSIPFGHGFVAYGQRKDAETAVQQTKGLLNIRDSMVLVELCDNGPSSSATSSRPANSSARPHSPPPRSDTSQPLKPFNFEKIWPIRREIMKVLLEKFLINPPEVKSDWITLFNRIKEALTHYEDNFFEIDRKRNPSWNLPYLKQFAAMVFMDWDFLRGEKDNFHLHYAAFQKYERSLPTYGAIMLTEDFEKVLLVKGRQGNWGFPKGKIAHKDEEPAVCANREVNEEIGYKIAAKLNVDHFFETSLNGRPTGLFLIHGVPEMTDFKRRDSEITGVKWVLVRELESAVSEEDLISPFIKLIRDWIDKEERKKSDLSDRAFPMVSES